MTHRLKVALIRGSLPSYFPEKHHVWAKAQEMLNSLCGPLEVDLFVPETIPMDAKDTEAVLRQCQEERVDFVLLLHGGFTMGDVSRTIAASEFMAGFWSVPEPVRTGDVQLNNFVSLNMSMSIARQVRDLKTRPVQWYHGDPESDVLRARMRTSLKALRAKKSLEGARVGVIGGLAMTFYNMEVSTCELMSRFGVEVTLHDMHELTEAMAAFDESAVALEVESMSRAASIEGVSPTQMALTARASLALRQIAKNNAYDALAVSDWPALQNNPGMHPGAAFTWLEETYALPVASEGDVLGAITQLVAKSLTGRVGYLLDMTEPDLEANQLMMWHGGGGPLYLADKSGARWVNHPMIGRGTPEGPVYGAIADLVFADGPVGVFRIARHGAALFEMSGIVAGRDPSGFTGCRGWLENFRIFGAAASLEDVVASVMAHGLEHHFVLVPGNISSELAEFASWCAMEPLSRRPMRDHLMATDFSD